MADYSNSVMVALLPVSSEWCRQETPHLTIVYAGNVEDLRPYAFNDMAKDAVDVALRQDTVMLRVIGPDVFGDDEKVDVLRLQATPELMAIRNVFKMWDVSEHPFNPHVTIGPVGPPIPDYPRFIVFDRIMVSFGDQDLTWELVGPPSGGR